MAFNLAEQAERSAKQEDGITVRLVDPAGHDTGATITLAGPDSRRALKSRRAAWRHVVMKRGDKEREREVTAEETAEAGSRLLAGAVIAWDGMFRGADNEPLECTIDNVLETFRKVPWVEELCDVHFGVRENFTQG
jgi:hypothetical protein